MIYFENNEIKIRDIRSEDIINLFSWRIDKEINKFDPRPIPITSEELIEECRRYCSRFDIEIMPSNIDDRKYMYFMIENNEGNCIGFVNLFSFDKLKKQCEMGVTIGDKRYWNKGIAYTAIENVIDYAFNNMCLKRIYIETGETNTAALKLFEKLEFQKCGEYLEDDDFKFIVMEKIKDIYL